MSASRRLLPARWIRISGTPVHLTAAGRIDRGGPQRWRGVHVRDVVVLEKQRRRLHHLDCPREARAELRRRHLRTTFGSKREAIAVIRALNANWFDDHDPAIGYHVAREHADRSGRRRLRREDLAGKRKGLLGGFRTSWDEVLSAILPSSRRWADVPARLQDLHDAVARDSGGHAPPLLVPEDVYQAEEVTRAYEDCEGVRQAMLGEIMERARRGRLRGGRRQTFEYDESVPF